MNKLFNSIDNKERQRILEMHEFEKNKSKLLLEDLFSGIIGKLARSARTLVTKNEDDIIKALRTTEVALSKDLDEIVSASVKNRNMSNIETLEAKLIHIFDPSGTQTAMAQEQTKKFLNAYAKSKNKTGWRQIRDEVSGNPQPKMAQTSSQAARDMFKGQRISNRWYGFTDPNYANGINWGVITNAKNMDDYNKVIAKAIKTGDYSTISRGGFEKFGIPNFREYLQKNIAKINEVDPSTGRWSVNFK